MKTTKLFKSYHLLLMISLLLGISSCKKDKTEAREELAASIDDTEVLPGKNIIITLDEASGKETLDVTVGGASVILFKIDETRYGGIMPVLPEGNYTIDVQGVILESPITIKVPAYSAISDPTPILNEFKDEISQSIDSLKAMNQSTPGSIDIDFVEKLKSEYQGSVAKLSATEKVQLAYYLKANPFKFSMLNKTVTGPSDSKFKVMGLDAGDHLVITSEKMAIAVVVAAGAAGATAASLIWLYKFPSNFAVTAVGVSFITYVIAMEAAGVKAAEVGKLTGIAEALIDWHSTQNVLALKKDVVSTISLQMQYRSINQHDINNSNAVIKQVVDGDNRLIQEDSKIASIFQKILQYFPSISSYSTYQGSIATASIKEIKNAQASNLAINNVSDPTINLTYSKTEDKLKIKATSTSATERAFTFDIIYKNEGLGVTVKKTINATYSEPADSTAIYAASVPGNWTDSHYGILSGVYQFYRSYKMELYANGTGIFPMKPNGFVKDYQITWKVIKIVGGYSLDLRTELYNGPATPADRPELLSYPVNRFKVYDGGGTMLTRDYIKN